MNNTEKLAEEFARIIREWLTAEEMIEVNRLNDAEPENSGICHSHDFCDANMALVEALDNLGIENSIDLPNDTFDERVAYIYAMKFESAAWDLAKSNHFYVGDGLTESARKMRA